MNKKKWTSLLMILALLLTLLPAPELSATAEGDTPSDKDNGMKISKTAAPNNDDGTYTITLEAYATGSKVISEVKKDIPTDIILVLDQSGSMSNTFSTTTEDSWESYGNQTNGNNYDLRMRNNNQNGNLYYKLSDGSYVGVSIDRTSETIQEYVEYNAENSICYTSKDTLYAETDEGYKQVDVKRSWNYYTYTYTYTYTRNDGTVVTKTSDRAGGNPPYTIYRLQDTYEYTYEYYYTVNGIRTMIGTQSRGEDTTFDVELYKRLSAGTSITALEALQRAVRNFTSAVETKAAGKDGVLGTSDDINHRIAVVGFASDSGYGNNTELLSISGQNSGSVGVAYNNITDQNLKDVLQNMNTTAGQTMVTNAINALAANGATQTDLGVDMAKRILDMNPVETNKKRNRVVIVFTDGSPTISNGFQKKVANDAIGKASDIKNAGTTVYTVGIFSGADASSAGTEPSGDLSNNISQLTAACNWFMQQVSSNNGMPKSPSYYLSAGDSGSLNNIFQQISDQIQTGGSSTTLDSSTVIKDIISPSFVLQQIDGKPDIKLYTANCTGEEGGTLKFSKKVEVSAEAGISATKTTSYDNDSGLNLDQVDVTGFDFSKNWCGKETENGATTYRGQKLVIEIKVTPRPGFFGGNGVYTNTSAGVYPDETATDPVLTFDRPKTDVTIKKPTITLPDANVYLGAYFDATVNAEDLKKGTTVKFGGNIELDLTKPNENWGLEDWQTEYVTIEVKVTDNDGNEVTEFGKLKDDTQYKVSVSIKPKTSKEGNNGYDEAMTGTIHVFKPELTFKDSTVEYKKTTVANTVYYVANNKVGDEVWKNGGKTSTDAGVNMLGTKPELALTYTTAGGMFDNNDLVISTEDIPVKVTVKIDNDDVTRYTTFVHQACDPACGWNYTVTNGNPAFLLHVKDVYADLTITKSGADAVDENQSFLFKVTGPDNYSTEVIVVGNGSVTLKNLKIGTYTVTEDTSWSWRYTPTNNGQKITLAANGSNEVMISNTRKEDQWLDGNVRADNKFTGAAATTD